jgi:hypothetical protein
MATGKVCEYKFVPRKKRTSKKNAAATIPIVATATTATTVATAVEDTLHQSSVNSFNCIPSVLDELQYSSTTNVAEDDLLQYLTGSQPPVTINGSQNIPAPSTVSYSNSINTDFNSQIASSILQTISNTPLIDDKDPHSTQQPQLVTNLMFDQLTKSFLADYPTSQAHDFHETHFSQVSSETCSLDKSPLEEVNHEVMSEKLNQLHLNDVCCSNDNHASNLSRLLSEFKIQNMDEVIDVMAEEATFTKSVDYDVNLVGYRFDDATGVIIPPSELISNSTTPSPPYPFQNNSLLWPRTKNVEDEHKDADSDIVEIIDNSLDILHRHQQEHSEVEFLEFDHLIGSCILNSPTKHLQINKFELRLLNYFSNVCIPMFSYGTKDSVYRSWKSQFPSLFLGSDLIRKAMFSFASITLLPVIDMDRAIRDDKCITFDVFKKKSIKYFMDSTSDLNSKLQHLNLENIDPKSAPEIVISGILLYSYIAVHHHQICPLISFDDENTSLIAICRSIRNTVRLCIPLLNVHPALGLFGLNLDDKEPYRLSPLFSTILHELNQFYNSEEEINPEQEIIHETIMVLQQALSLCVRFNYSVPLTRGLFRLSNEFYELCQQKKVFALRILFVYSFLCYICDIMIYSHSNIWLDFMVWYINQGYGYKLDKTLYKLITEEKYKLHSYVSFENFDPEFIYQTIKNQKLGSF